MSSTEPLLIADIGGTNLRFALLQNGVVGDSVSYPWPSPPSIEGPAKDFINRQNVRPRRAAFACASAHPDLKTISMVNVGETAWGYTFVVDELRQVLGLDELHMLNDFTAVALSVPLLGPQDLFAVGSGQAKPVQPVGVLGAGTGLGCSGLVWSGARYIPVSGEGGHVTLGGTNAREDALIEWLHTKFEHVSAERVLSGPGLVNLHEAIRGVDKLAPLERSPKDIMEFGLAGTDAACRETLDIFCSLFGSVAGNLALILGATGGVYIGGGLAPRMTGFIAQSAFRQRFCAKGRYQQYLEAIPTSIIMHPAPGLLGAGAALQQ